MLHLELRQSDVGRYVDNLKDEIMTHTCYDIYMLRHGREYGVI
jgi:hypothetical protein